MYKFDAFMSHDWGKERVNHEKVLRIHGELKRKGLSPWVDQEQMSGNIYSKMCEGIDGSACVIVFVTENYMKKVGGDNMNDNCRLEFNYAAQRKTSLKIVPVVMEAALRDISTWTGRVGMFLAGTLYVDMSGDLSDPLHLVSKVDELNAAIINIIGESVAVKSLRSPIGK